MSEQAYYLVSGECVDCGDPANRQKCVYLLSTVYYLGLDYGVTLELTFNRDLLEISDLNAADIQIVYGETGIF